MDPVPPALIPAPNSDLDAREIEETARLIRGFVRPHPEVALLQAAGVYVTLGYGPTGVWLQLADRVIGRVDSLRWWDPGTETREGHAAWLAHELAVQIAARPDDSAGGQR